MAVTTPSLQPFFPYIPDYTNWEDWTGNMIIHYGQENIMLSSEEDWKEGALNMAKMEKFGSYPVPNPEFFENWQDWAKEFTLIINGRSY
jgi:hypothetical protein